MTISAAPAPSAMLAGTGARTCPFMPRAAEMDTSGAHFLQRLRERLGELATNCRLAPRAHLYRAGDVSSFVHLVTRGVAKLYYDLPGGKRRITAFAFAGDLIGMEDRGVAGQSAQAVTTLTTLRIPVESLDIALREDSDLASGVVGKISRLLTEAHRHAVTLGRSDALVKLAMFIALLECQNDANQPPGLINVPMSRSDIADYVGLTLEAVSRSLRALERARVLKFHDRHVLEVLDQGRLNDLVFAG
jgi:CRP/FNR family transcriptional regulator